MSAVEDVSPEALAAVLGAASYAVCVQAALDAPPPSPAVVERVRLLFAPGLREIAEEQRAKARTTRRNRPARAA
jgi:hypothetical protein